jgi:RNA polymerase sigma factor (sigma-70 family)
MAGRSLQSSIRSVLHRLKVHEAKRLSDSELLQKYATAGDEAAFTALVSRHGPTVLSVCRRILKDQDVDDAFQATFLALARDAGSIRRLESVGSWLYEVAYHASVKARARRSREQHLERAAAKTEASEATDEVAYCELQQVLDEELHRLPERLRRPVVLVYLLGQTQADAANELGITDRAVRKRLETAREKLRFGLNRRGLTLTTAALATALERSVAGAAVPPGLLTPTVESVLAYATGHAAPIPASTVKLAMAGVGGWLAGRFKLVCSLVAIPVFAAAVFTAHALTPSVAPDASRLSLQQPTTPRAITPSEGRTHAIMGQVFGENGLPIPYAAVTALVRRPWQATDRTLRDEVAARTSADATGRYRLSVGTDFPTWYSERLVTLLAHAPGHAPISLVVAIRGRSSEADLRFRGHATVRGRLLRPDNRPASDVRLVVVRLGHVARELSQGEEPPPAPQGWPADVTTDGDGLFRLDGLPSGEKIWLQVQDDRYALTTMSTTVGASEPAALVLAEARLYMGRIVATDTQQPLAGARVSIFAGSRATHTSHYTALAVAPDAAVAAPLVELTGRSDSEGRFRIRLPVAPEYHAFIYPPEASAFVARQAKLIWTEGEVNREQQIALMPGVEVRGQVLEEDGRPIAGACTYYAIPSMRPNPLLPSDMTPFRDTATLTGPDGSFRIVVPPVSCRLEVFGPTADYQPASYDYQPCPYCTSGHQVRMFEHGLVTLNPVSGSPQEPVCVRLRRGRAISGNAIDPSGEPIHEGILICRTVAHPLRSPVPRPLPIRDGVFELPGCVAGRIYPVLLLDATRRMGAIAEIDLPRAADLAPTISLKPCGSATVRLVDASGRPVPGCRPLVRFGLANDRPAGESDRGPDAIRPAQVYTSWIDALNYLPGPVTSAEGTVQLPALVAGLEYSISFIVDSRAEYRTRPFRVLPGECVRLPDVVAGDADAGHFGNEP